MNEINTDELNAEDTSRSNRLDQFLLANLPPLISLEGLQSRTVEQSIEAAIQRVKTASKAHYDSISVLSTYWEADETGGVLDTNLFLQTISQLHDEDTRVTTDVHVLPDNAKVHHLIYKINSLVEALMGARRLFILHYPGHGVGGNDNNNLIITSRISRNEINGSHLNMTLVRDTLRDLASTNDGVDVLILLDCCSASLAGRGKISTGKRVELMAATSAGGLSNSREDGETFTIYWCRSFDGLMKEGVPFNCDAIMSSINKHPDLEQFPATFVLREGFGVPITFRAPTTTSAQYPQTIITAFNVEEEADLKVLIDYLQNAKSGFKIKVLSALPIAGQ